MSDAQIADFYEVSMAHPYLSENLTSAGTFSLAVRHLPPGRGFLVAAGLESVLERLSWLRIDEDDIETYASALGRPARELCSEDAESALHRRSAGFAPSSGPASRSYRPRHGVRRTRARRRSAPVRHAPATDRGHEGPYRVHRR